MVKVNSQRALQKAAEDAGVVFVSGYPGYIASNFIKEFEGFENGVNERSAVDMAHMHSYLGKRSMVVMKNAGLNEAALAVRNSCDLGANAGMVVVVSDDEQGKGSENIQDSRGYADVFGTLMLEPRSAREVYEKTLEAFELSEKFELPVLIRVTNKVNDPLKSEEVERRGVKSEKGRCLDDWVLHPTTSGFFATKHEGNYQRALGNDGCEREHPERVGFKSGEGYGKLFDLVRERNPGIVVGDFGSYTLADGSPVNYGLHYGGAMASAVGASLAGVERVYALVGDGAFTHSTYGLLEASRRGSDVNFVVIDNGGISGKVETGVDLDRLAYGSGADFVRRVSNGDLSRGDFDDMEKHRGASVLVVEY